jgi:hypothetical protein
MHPNRGSNRPRTAWYHAAVTLVLGWIALACPRPARAASPIPAGPHAACAAVAPHEVPATLLDDCLSQLLAGLATPVYAFNAGYPFNRVAMAALPPTDFTRPGLRTVRTGAFLVNVHWGENEFGDSDLQAHIDFIPNPKACPLCSRIRFIQIARVTDHAGKDLIWTSGEANRERLKTVADVRRHIEENFYVDIQTFKARSSPASAAYADYWPAGARTGSNLPGQSPVAAAMEDAPFGWSEITQIHLEAAAVSVDTGKVLGSVTWGGVWPPTGPQRLLPIRATNDASPTFYDALRRFDAFYCNNQSTLR